MNISFEQPTLSDGMSVFHLVKACPPLDGNSSYCNLLQCSHFADTAVTAKVNGELVGFVSGYIQPQKPDTLFVWQVAVAEAARGAGLALRMLEHIIGRPNCAHVRFIETSITEDNQASRALFARLAKNLAADLHILDWMDKDTHFDGQHDSEPLIRVGPFTTPAP